MNVSFFKLLTKYVHLLPHNIFKFLSVNQNKLIRSEKLFDTIEYKSEYKGDSLEFFFLPLLTNIFQISNDIKKLINKNQLISIFSVLVFYNKDTGEKFEHSLTESNKLYSLKTLDKWPANLVFNLIEKLELYKSFTKISLKVKLRVTTPL